jgi:hypothetical protein
MAPVSLRNRAALLLVSAAWAKPLGILIVERLQGCRDRFTDAGDSFFERAAEERDEFTTAPENARMAHRRGAAGMFLAVPLSLEKNSAFFGIGRV